MEGFNEQVVKRDKTAKSLVIKIVAVVLLFVIPLTLVFLGRFIPYMAMVGLFVFIGGIYVVWWVFTSQKVEYEYSVNGDTLNVAKIISLRRRKRVCDINIKDIELLEVGDQTIRERHFGKLYYACKNPADVTTNTFAVFADPMYSKCLLVFNPNQAILDGMKPYLRRELVVKLFYHKS